MSLELKIHVWWQVQIKEGEVAFMAKIGIMNLQEVDNFGCVLGAYAILNMVRRLSFDSEVELVDFRSLKFKLSVFARIQRKLLLCRVYGLRREWKRYWENRHMRSISKTELPEKVERFERFRSEYLIRSDPCTIETLQEIPQYDIYLVGSDVVWLFDDLCFNYSPMLLDFTDGYDCFRVSYAASLGNDPEAVPARSLAKRIYRKGLSRFDRVSVREEASVRYLSDLYSGEISCCMDPTLLLGPTDYEAMVKQAKVGDRTGYIYVYTFNETGLLFEKINQISRELGVPIIRCCDQTDGYENVIEAAEGDGPCEFLKRIKDADLVITNSFHAICFSLIYHKNFYAIRRVMQSYKIEELLKKIGLSDRYLDSIDTGSGVNTPINYENTDKILADWRRESLDFLKNSLHVQ